MSVIKINAIEIPEGQGPELEARFAARKHSVDDAPGFKGFQMLRPTKGEDRYFIITEGETDERLHQWLFRRRPPPDSTGREPVATGSALLAFQVVNLDEIAPAPPAQAARTSTVGYTSPTFRVG